MNNTEVKNLFDNLNLNVNEMNYETAKEITGGCTCHAYSSTNNPFCINNYLGERSCIDCEIFNKIKDRIK
jgi:hypothetical protein